MPRPPLTGRRWSVRRRLGQRDGHEARGRRGHLYLGPAAIGRWHRPVGHGLQLRPRPLDPDHLPEHGPRVDVPVTVVDTPGPARPLVIADHPNHPGTIAPTYDTPLAKTLPTLTTTPTDLSCSVEGCDRAPGPPGRRKVSPDGRPRGCQSGHWLRIWSAGELPRGDDRPPRSQCSRYPRSDSQGKSGRRKVRRKVSPDVATFPRTRHKQLPTKPRQIKALSTYTPHASRSELSVSAGQRFLPSMT